MITEGIMLIQVDVYGRSHATNERQFKRFYEAILRLSEQKRFANLDVLEPYGPEPDYQYGLNTYDD